MLVAPGAAHDEQGPLRRPCRPLSSACAGARSKPSENLRLPTGGRSSGCARLAKIFVIGTARPERDRRAPPPCALAAPLESPRDRAAARADDGGGRWPHRRRAAAAARAAGGGQ